MRSRARACLFKMEARWWRRILIAVVFQYIQVQIGSAVKCHFVHVTTYKLSCKCILADGSGEIDISPLFAGGALSANGTGAV